ncbi:MAG: c-type cytochrome [Campylobacterales bacterium]|nr:c-type cytochrome [Campylobacterales bacterium]
MKLLLPVVCSILLIGCGNSTKNSTSDTQQVSQPQTAEAPAISEKTTTASIPASEIKPTQETVAVSSTSETDGGALFSQKCAACHGNKAEKSALGKSQIIADFTEKQIKDALQGYQAGSYGKEMKGLMQGQVKLLTPEQINALAKHIPTL